MMSEQFFEDLKEQVKKIVGERGSHDFSHIERVYNLSILISKDLNVDLDIVKTAALLHDVARPKEDKGKIKDHAAQGAIDARKILRKTEFPKEKIETVCKCILLHNKKEDLESVKEVRILKEADGLEAMGAIGIARSFSFLGEKHVWKNHVLRNPLDELYRNVNLEYFRLPIAKELGARRVEITKNFCDQFTKEFNSKI